MPHIQVSSASESITDRRFKADEPIWIPLTTPPYPIFIWWQRSRMASHRAVLP